MVLNFQGGRPLAAGVQGVQAKGVHPSRVMKAHLLVLGYLDVVHRQDAFRLSGRRGTFISSKRIFSLFICKFVLVELHLDGSELVVTMTSKFLLGVEALRKLHDALFLGATLERDLLFLLVGGRRICTSKHI